MVVESKVIELDNKALCESFRESFWVKIHHEMVFEYLRI